MDEKIFSKETISNLKKELPFLEEEQRIAIHCRFWENMDIFEISRVLNLGWDETYSLLKTALAELKIKLLKNSKLNHKTNAA